MILFLNRDASQGRRTRKRRPRVPHTFRYVRSDSSHQNLPARVLTNLSFFTFTFHTTTDDLLAVLNTPHLFGAALDVTDPEPLPAQHPLWSHPKCIITPHLSGNTQGEMEIAADVLLFNVQRMKDGKEVVNEVRWDRGY